MLSPLLIGCGLTGLAIGHGHGHNNDHDHEHHHHGHHHHNVRRLGSSLFNGNGNDNGHINGAYGTNGKFYAIGRDWISQEDFTMSGSACGYIEPSHEERQRAEQTMRDHQDWMDTLIAAGEAPPRPWNVVNGIRGLEQQEEFIDIKVYFNVLRKADGTGDVSNDIIFKQIDVLNAGFGGTELSSYSRCGGSDLGTVNTYIRFNLDPADIRRETNDNWFNNIDNDATHLEIKTALHKGTCRDLNIYTGQSEYLGFAYVSTYHSSIFCHCMYLLYRSIYASTFD